MIARLTDKGVSCDRLRAEITSQPQITELYDTAGRDEDIGGFDVAMHDPLDVHVLERGRYLHEVLPDGLLRDQSLLLLEMFDHLG